MTKCYAQFNLLEALEKFSKTGNSIFDNDAFKLTDRKWTRLTIKEKEMNKKLKVMRRKKKKTNEHTVL